MRSPTWFPLPSRLPPAATTTSSSKNSDRDETLHHQPRDASALHQDTLGTLSNRIARVDTS
ncbi:hypothetical protein GYH30_025255 [Glycine max]|nr:hypothetical protein GYH30_025255 [Glycine max]